MATSYRTVTPPAVAPAHRWAHAGVFTRHEWSRLAALYAFIALLHVAGWGFYLHYAAAYPSLVGLGVVAYMLGLRHAFDADHIAAVDDTVRFMMQRGERPLAVGFFFSLGHSTIVFVLAVALVIATSVVKDVLPGWREAGALIGAGVSGAFLCAIGILNLAVLLDIVRVWRRAGTRTHGHAHVEALLAQRGLMGRLFGGRLRRLVTRSWQMYPLGLLFGLGFDTASEIALLALTAGAAAGSLPIAAILSLPLLFTAGMTAMDTTDGVLMTRAYAWAFVNPLRRIFYNLTITGMSVIVALGIGVLELAQVIVRVANLHGSVADGIVAVDFGALGYFIVAVFLAAWAGSALLWRWRRPEPAGAALHSHPHVHEHGVTHAHRHFH